MNQENKKNIFYNSSLVSNDPKELVDLLEEELKSEASESKKEDEISKVLDYVSKLGKLPIFFQDKEFLYTISENIYISNKLNTKH